MNRIIKIFLPVLIAILIVDIVLVFLNPKNPDITSTYTYKIVKTYPHDPNAFTQGLVFDNGILYEGTGLKGSSTLRKVELKTGNVLQIYEMPKEYFGEGITIYGGKIIQLTYQDKVGFVYDKNSFKLLRQFNYLTEGWGLTHDGTNLIMSDGTSSLYFLSPETFERVKRVRVFDNEVPVWGLNELEYIDGYIYANVWPTEKIAVITHDTGQVKAWINMKGLLSNLDNPWQVDVFNGIAYDPKTGHLFVTGKFWPELYEIKLIPKK